MVKQSCVELVMLILFVGKITGLAHEGVLPSYIVECLDGFIPNETYQYRSCIIPMCYIEDWNKI